MNRLVGSITLIAGTAIGAGMLSLPVATSFMGLGPSIVMFTIMACLMTYVGLLILEVLSILPANATMISMASDTMGLWGRRAAIVSYFFLLAALNVAYLSGATNLILLSCGCELSVPLRALIGGILSFGCGFLATTRTQLVDKVNRWMVGGMVACFAIMMLTVLPFMQSSFLADYNWSYCLAPLALVLTSFGYHPIIPNIFDYLERNVRRTRLAIIIGTFIPLGVYLMWQLMVLGSVSLEGDYGLRWAFTKGLPATESLAATLNIGYLPSLTGAFALLAILTSFLGTMLAMAEFIADAYRWPLDGVTKPRIAMIMAGPLLLFTLMGTRIFISALSHAGIWAAILLGCLPIVMAALARLRHKTQYRPYLVQGGYALMALCMLCFLTVIFIELLPSHM